MKVIVKEEYRKASEKFYSIPEEERGNEIFLSCADLLPGKTYDVLGIGKHGWYHIIDESGDWYSYPPQMFEIVEK